MNRSVEAKVLVLAPELVCCCAHERKEHVWWEVPSPAFGRVYQCICTKKRCVCVQFQSTSFKPKKGAFLSETEVVLKRAAPEQLDLFVCRASHRRVD